MVSIASKKIVEKAFKELNPTQIKSEIVELSNLVGERKPTYVMEIGSKRGGTLYIWMNMETVSTLISVDLPWGSFGGGDYDLGRIQNLAPDKDLAIIRDDSHKEKTLERVREELRGHKLDFLFIDGDHTYEGVKQDFEMYGSLVSDGGIIAFHDIVSGPPSKVGGVPEFWKEIKTECSCREIIEDRNQEGYGIGVLFKR